MPYQRSHDILCTYTTYLEKVYQLRYFISYALHVRIKDGNTSVKKILYLWVNRSLLEKYGEVFDICYWRNELVFNGVFSLYLVSLVGFHESHILSWWVVTYRVFCMSVTAIREYYNTYTYLPVCIPYNDLVTHATVPQNLQVKF